LAYERRAGSASGCLVAAAAKEMTMARTPHRRNSKKQGERLKAMARARRLFNLKKNKEPLISDRILKLLAAAELPLQKQAYQAKLSELLGE
jgi:hypothetical protein